MKQNIPGRGLFLLLLLLLLCCACAAAAGEAENLAAGCAYSWPKGSGTNAEALYDGGYGAFWESLKAKDTWLEVTLPEGEVCSGVQIRWYGVNPDWCVETKQGGEWVRAGGYESDALATWTPLDGVTEFRISLHGKKAGTLKICELQVFGAGERPAWVQDWAPPPERADLMIVAAHPGDEFLYFGGLIPYYGTELGKDVVVVILAQCGPSLQAELLDALWTAGQRTYPVLAQFYDRYTMRTDIFYERIGKNTVRGFMIEQFRRFRPMVVVTHDENGENGHGLHKLCAEIVKNALLKSGDATIHKASSKEFGTWAVPKCYLHLYGEEPLRFDWNGIRLESFGGRTAYEVADAAWRCYRSKAGTGGYRVFSGEPFDAGTFGLFHTAVGGDGEGRDLFGNVPEREEEVE